MPRANSCCNPLNKKKHSCVYKNVSQICETWNNKFKNLVGFFISQSCKVQVHNQQNVITCLRNSVLMKGSPIRQFDSVSDTDDSSDISVHLEDNDKYFEVSTPKKVRHETPADKQKSTGKISMDENWLSDLKSAILNEDTRAGKISLLTTVPLTWSIRQMKKEFDVSRRMASQAKKLHASAGYGTRPKQKSGKCLDNSTIEKVNAFFLRDEVSRLMPGAKDYISVVENGQRQQKQKRLLLNNVNILHEQFLEENQEIKISLAKFQKLRPKECISAGQRGTHNVCVCKIHQNMKLKFEGVKKLFVQKGKDFSYTIQDALKDMLCENPTPDCYFNDCEKCSGTSVIIEKLKVLFEQSEISTVTFNQWTSTDRCELLSKSEPKEEFLNNLKKDFPDFARHDFLSKSQASFFRKIKTLLEEDEVVVTLDFAENYTCQSSKCRSITALGQCTSDSASICSIFQERQYC